MIIRRFPPAPQIHGAGFLDILLTCQVQYEAITLEARANSRQSATKSPSKSIAHGLLNLQQLARRWQSWAASFESVPHMSPESYNCTKLLLYPQNLSRTLTFETSEVRRLSIYEHEHDVLLGNQDVHRSPAAFTTSKVSYDPDAGGYD
ncbi:hypothetical protein Vi05172_g12843 [Venturia inaequalis]|nr:hypothetical protein Vi05172_g12843 [Venturia inaequalis]